LASLRRRLVYLPLLILAITGIGAADITHGVGPFNEVASVGVDGATPVDYVYERAGNLVHEGDYWYRYDAWQRLIQVVREDPADEFLFDADGVMTAASPIEPADVVAVLALVPLKNSLALGDLPDAEPCRWRGGRWPWPWRCRAVAYRHAWWRRARAGCRADRRRGRAR